VTTGIGHRWGPDRRQPDVALAPPLSPAAAWGAIGSDVGYPPLVASGTAFLSYRHGEIAAVDLRTASVRWRQSLASAYAPGLPPHEGALLLAGERLFVRVADRLLELDATTGMVRSDRAAPPLDLVQGVMEDGAIVSQVSDGEACVLLAWEIDAGRVRWQQPIEWSLGPPMAATVERVFAADGGRVVAYGLFDGRLHWSVAPGVLSGQADAGASALCVAPDGTLVVACRSALLGLEAASGGVKWQAPLPVRSSSNLSLAFDGSAVVTELGTVCEIDTLAGTVRVHTVERGALPPGTAGRFAPAMLTSTHAFLVDVSGPVIALSRASFEVDWAAPSARRRTPADMPVAGAGHLFLLDEAGGVECFESAP
jgi:outer membrane protein assembly factor BamB